MSVKPHFEATFTINATLPSNSLRLTVASVPRRFAEKSYAPFMTTASTARREETDAWREPELSANPLADETKNVPATRKRSIFEIFFRRTFSEQVLVIVQGPRIGRSVHSPYDVTVTNGHRGNKDEFGTNASQDAIAAQIRYLVYLRIPVTST